MGIRACLSVLLTAGALLVPLFSASAENSASSTPEALPIETASSTESVTDTEPVLPAETEIASTSASSTPESTTIQTLSLPQNMEALSPFDRGFGAQTEELPTLYESLPGFDAFAISATIDGISVSDGDILDITPRDNILVVASTTITGTSAIDAEETRSLAEAVHTTIAIYRGVPGNAELVAGTYTISEAGILSDIGGVPLAALDVGPAFSEPGEYFMVVHPEFGANEYPTGWSPQEFGGPRIDFVPKWDFWANHDFYTKQTLYQGSQVFGILRFTIGAPTPEHQMSNVLFLPGIKGSRLYGEKLSCVSTQCVEKFWEPEFFSNVARLRLNSEGESIEEIYTLDRDVVAHIETFDKDLYVAFGAQLSALKSAGHISDWKPVAYDWRLSLKQIVEGGRVEEERIYYDEAVESPYIEKTLRELASTSKSGQVTIVAHSNGGLVAKALMQKLGDADTASLIDDVILLGVPQAGAPQTIGALLFGHKEGLPFDWLPVVMNTSDAREIALNSPMSYHLLPTERYFDSLTGVEHPVARFYADTHHVSESAAYGEVIDSVDELHAYLRADEGGRTMPERADLESANVLNSRLLSYANDIHAQIDVWTPPEGVELYQVAGWGADTIAGYEFYEEPVRLPFLSGTEPKFRPIFVEDGDGVVPVPSALAMPQSERVKNYWINLRQERQGHATLLESERVRNLIEEVLKGQEPHEVLDHVSRSGHSPWIVRPHKQLRFALHSPLTLSVIDEDGNTTGLIEDGEIVDEIAGGRFGQIGDMKFVSVPFGPTYTVNMHGLAEGSFSLDIEEIDGDVVTERKTLAGLPASVTTIATLVTNSVATLTNLIIDTDGDGGADISLEATDGAVIVYEPTEVMSPSEPKTEQPTESEGSLSSGGGNSSRNPKPGAVVVPNLTATTEPAVSPKSNDTIPLDIGNSSTTTPSELPDTIDMEAPDETAPASEDLKAAQRALPASALVGFQQLLDTLLMRVVYTIKEAFIKLLSLFL